ncbi:ABC transporter permease [bacterium]|nr:ABC transporter permease [bacterium]MBU1025685.1 ABC transporter permease [bacterium]
MEKLITAIVDAFKLLFSFDREVFTLIGTSFHVSLISTLIATIIAVPVGVLFGLSDFRGRRYVDVVFNTMLFLPTVVVGHLVYMFLTRDGIFGSLGLLFTRPAIITGQVILAAPIILTMVSNAVRVADRRILSTALTLGVSRFKAYFMLLSEVKALMMLAVIAGFGRVISEIGVSMMLGGNIENKTRTITTGMAQLTSMGEFAKATALGIVLLIIVFGVNFIVYSATHRTAH